MSFYLDTNIFYNAYSPVEESEVAEWILNQLTPEFPGITSEWTVIEMFRAFKKQVNLQNIEEIDANLVLNLFLSELGDYIQHKQNGIKSKIKEIMLMSIP